MSIIRLQTSGSTLDIAPELGGSIVNFHININGELRPIIRQVNNPKSALDCGSFPLVPFSNRIRNGKFIWNNREIQLPVNMPPIPHTIHGSGWQQPWQVVAQSDTTLSIEYQNQCPHWPFDFVATQIFELEDHTLTVRSTLKNLSDETMPAGSGAHPYFTRTPKTKVTCDLPQMWAVDDQCLPTDITPSVFAASENNTININDHVLDNVFMNVNAETSAPALIVWPEWQIQAALRASDNCRFMVIYSPEKESFFCLEPVTHCTDAFNRYQAGETDTGIQILQPQATLKTEMQIAVTSFV